MKKFSALVLAGFAVFALNGCTGGTTDGTTDDGYIDNGGGTTGGSLSLYDLNGMAIVDYDGSSIDFCNGYAYVYDNYNGEHTGEYYLSNGDYTISFLDDAGGSYRIDTNSGYLYEGSTYSIAGVETFTIDSIESANCY